MVFVYLTCIVCMAMVQLSVLKHHVTVYQNMTLLLTAKRAILVVADIL